METTSHSDWVRNALAHYEGPLLRYAKRLTGDMETAQDVVQDTFLKLCQADRAKIADYLAAWLYRVCRNRALDVVKKERRMQPTDDALLAAYPGAMPPPGAVAASHETEALVKDTLSSLPGPQQEVCLLKFQDQLSYKEISEATGHPVNHVRYLIHISLRQLRASLADHMDLVREN